ncbi:MAG: hypothetical protein JWP87_2865 [Labilithrix sp.]|nr:hypothetical protein [Labilithrix sp.]
MTQRGPSGDGPARDPAAMQELAAGVVHGVYRTVKACQFHADVSNDAVTSLTASAAAAVAEYCTTMGTETVALSFLGEAIFVNRQILKASRDTHALAAELRDLLASCEVTELTLSRTVDRAAISSFAKLLADVQRDRSFVTKLTSGEIPGIAAGKARFASTGTAREESPGQRAARTYATSVLTVQGLLADVRQGKFELPRRIKRVAQQVVARADEDARLLVALAATGGVSLDAATIAVGSAILSVAITRQLTTDRAVLANAAMAALLYDAGRVLLGGNPDGTQRILNDDELDKVPTRTVLALTALGRMHAPARARTALLYEVWSMRRAHRLGPIYKGRRPPTLLARIIGVARAFAELRGAGAGGGLSIDDALQVLGSRAADGTERALVKLLIGALGIYPAGTMVTLNTGELGVVMGTPAMPLDYVRPPVKILYDRDANLLETPVDVDLAAPAPGQPARFIAKSVDADEQQAKAMRSFVVAATAAKRRGALEAAEEQALQQRPIPEPTLQSAHGEADELAARVTRPPVVIDAQVPTHRPPVVTQPVTQPVPAPERRGPNEATPRSAHHVAPVRPAAEPRIEAKPEPPRRRDPRNDSAPPSSMMDEIHRPVRAARPARVPAVAPVPVVPQAKADDNETVRPPPSSASGAARVDIPPDSRPGGPDSTRQVSWESLGGFLPPESMRTPPPPPAREAAADDEPSSKRDDLLAAFLADAPIENIESDPPPAAKAPAKKAEKVTVKRDK